MCILSQSPRQKKPKKRKEKKEKKTPSVLPFGASANAYRAVHLTSRGDLGDICPNR